MHPPPPAPPAPLVPAHHLFLLRNTNDNFKYFVQTLPEFGLKCLGEQYLLPFLLSYERYHEVDWLLVSWLDRPEVEGPLMDLHYYLFFFVFTVIVVNLSF